MSNNDENSLSSANLALKRIRDCTQLSIREFAEKAEVSHSLIQAAETGSRKLKMKNAQMISAFTGCDPRCLIEGSAMSLSGKQYDESTYKDWCSKTVSRRDLEETIKFTAIAVESLVRAAEFDASGSSKPRRFREVVARLCMSVEDILDKHGLRDLLNMRLGQEAKKSKWQKTNLGYLRKQFLNVPEWSLWDCLGVGDDKELSYRRTLSPIWQPLFAPLPFDALGESASVVLKYKMTLELKAKWITYGNEDLNWAEWHVLEKGGAFSCFYSSLDKGPIKPYGADVSLSHQFGHP